MGLLADQDGIWLRYGYERTAWEGHLHYTKNYICRALDTATGSSVAVLGSGWLLDVPMDFLLERFNEVHCYDLRHPGRVREQYASQPRVKWVEMDLTGGLIQKTYQLCSHWQKADSVKLLRALQPEAFCLPLPADRVVSVNLLNQLDILILDYIRKFYTLTGCELNTLRGRIQQAHFELLDNYVSCFVTDYEEQHLDERGREIGSLPLIHCPLPEGRNLQHWVWHFDTHKTYHPNCKTFLKVMALELNT